MKHLNILLLLILLSTVFSLAQSNYKAGYVVTLNGDTVKGFVDYREWERNPKTFHFKKELTQGQKDQYSTADITAVGINGYEPYKRFIVWVSQDPSDEANLLNLSTGIDSTKIMDTVFLKVLNPGKNVTLYAYSDIIKLRFFIGEGNGTPVELIYHEYLDPANTSKILTQKPYHNQLEKLAVKYNVSNAGLTMQIQNAAYDDRDIFNVVNKINGSVSTEIVSVKRSVGRFFVGIGVNDINIGITGNNELSNSKSSSSAYPKIGAGADLYLDKNTRKFIFRTEIYYSGYEAQFMYQYNTGPYFSYVQLLKYNASGVVIAPQFLYNAFSTTNLKIYADAGLGINFCRYNNRLYTITTTTKFPSGDSQNLKSLDFPAMDENIFTIPIKVGFVIYKNFDVYMAYIPSTKLNNNDYTLHGTQYEAGVNYLFGK